MDKLAQKYPDRFKVYYTIDKLAEKKETSSWKGEVGYITADMLKKVLPLPAKKDDEKVLVMVCGPPGFMKLISGEKTKDFKQVCIRNSSTRFFFFIRYYIFFYLRVN